MSKAVFILDSNLTEAEMESKVDFNSDSLFTITELGRMFKGHSAGVYTGGLDVKLGATNASATITLIDGLAADDTLVFGSGAQAVTLTAAASPANENEFDAQGEAGTAAADSLAQANTIAAAINAHSVLSLVFTATAAAGASNDAVVTVESKVPGLVGRFLTVAEGVDANNHITVANFARNTDGAEGSNYNREF